MRFMRSTAKGVVTAGLVTALSFMAPASVVYAEEGSGPTPLARMQASSIVYVDPSSSGDPDTFASLSDAMGQVADGGTVRLKHDVDVNEPVRVGKDVMLDLNGHNIQGQSTATAECLYVEAGHTLTVDGGGAICPHHWHAIIVAGGSLVARNCKILGKDTPSIWVRDHGSLTLEGATVSTDAPNYVVNLLEGSSLVARSGTLGTTIGQPTIGASDDSTVSVFGGSFASPVPTAWCAEGYAPRMVNQGDEAAGYTVGKAIPVPTATDRAYSGAAQYGVDAQDGLVLSGTGTTVGSYTTTATPSDGYAWEPGSAVGAESDPESPKAVSEAGAAPKVFSWSVVPKQLTADMVSAPEQTYDGTAKTPVTLAFGGATLAQDTDYKVAYANNTNAGEGTYTLTGAGNYAGTLEGTFKINPANIAEATFGTIKDQTYTGKAITPKVSVIFAGKELVEGTDYELSYDKNTQVGTATITVTGKGNFTGTKELTFKIVAARGASGTSAQAKAATSGSSGTLARTGDATSVGLVPALVAGFSAVVAGIRRRFS